jgi:glycosyltransferase involved in cell wall biosynthesis
MHRAERAPDRALPRITVVTPSFNQAPFLERTIRSVVEQGYPDLEYFVMDGGSTDGSTDIIRAYADRIDHWVSERDGGQAAAINAGWRRATGQIVCWLNSDDFFMPGALLAIATAFVDHPSAALVYGRMRRVDAEGASLGIVGSEFKWATMLYSHQVIPQPAAFFSRAAVEQVGPLDERLHYSMDYDFLLRLAPVAKPILIPTVLAGATVHGEAKTTRDRAKAEAETHEVRRRYARGLGRIVVAAQPPLSAVFRRLPRALRGTVGGLRPRQIDPE